MNVDVVELRDFYDTRLGYAAQKSVSIALSAMMTKTEINKTNSRLLTVGYPVPFLDRFASEAERALCFMPAAQGAVHWPPTNPSMTALVYDEQLPLPDSCVDHILLVHSLEHSENVHEALSEAWRVLAPNGSITIVVPNRRGLWARFEHTPFGSGRPFSRGQLTRQLKSAMFTPMRWSDALHFPPVERRSFLKVQSTLERLGRRLWPVFAGAIIVTASKKLHQGLPVGAKARKKVFVPVLAPQGNAMNNKVRTQGREASEH